MERTEQEPGETPSQERGIISRAFGAENRARLLERYFADIPSVDPKDAWLHVYRLLLWIDRTTSLAHCYESDKAQPGRPWYGRSLAFHNWVSQALSVPPGELGEEIDWLFREAVKGLAASAVYSRSEAYRQQRVSYEGLGLPEPGEDAGLVEIISQGLAPWLDGRPSIEDWRHLTRRIHLYMSQENKRRNLVGEGFEDVLAAVVGRLSGNRRHRARPRCLLHSLDGFHPPPPNEKAKKVDLAIVDSHRRILVSVKWSVRADREEQFQSDFEAYARLESAGRDFDYVLVTNEFDAARLTAACERRRQNALLFTHVVHINPRGMLAAYGEAKRGATLRARDHVERGRLMDLQTWLEMLE